MTEQSWQLRQGNRLIGTLFFEEQDMFWSECRFEPEAAWAELRPLFEASRVAWERGDIEAALEADEVIQAVGLVLIPSGGGVPLTDFQLRIDLNTARFRY
ncbi:hypothetical protein [Amycolatopsis sp. NPDC001319]|uniref:hypothetical protein n=1 Tax=unclassified Amycolatopsis TaxID=2618356 RepID=UPI003681B802